VQLFLAKITRSIPEEAIRGVLGHFGTVEGLRMYKLSPEAVYHKVGGWVGWVGGWVLLGFVSALAVEL
jgi:hypothetical protein